MNKENKLILYKDEEGRVSVNTRFADEDVWLTQEQLATIYQTTQENVSMHITNIYTDKELDKEGTYKKFLLVRQELLVRNRTTAVESTCFSIFGFR